MSDASSGEGLFAVSMEDVLAGLRLHDESQASRKELVGPPNSETIQRLRAAQAAAEQNSSTPSDIPPPTPRMKHLELPDSFIPAVDIGKRSQPPKPPRSIKPPDETSGSIDTRDIDKDIASFAFRVGKSEVARYLLGLPEPEK